MIEPLRNAILETDLELNGHSLTQAGVPVAIGTAAWGGITGTLASQTDLNTALAAKAPVASPGLTGTPTAPTAAPGTNTTQLASTAFVAAAVAAGTVGLLDYRGTYNASGNVFPSSGGSGVAGAILKGDFWIVSTPGTLDGSAVTNGDLVIALVDTPGSTSTNWNLVEHDVGYAPENVANKSTDGTLAANSATLYPSQSAVKTYADTKAPIASPTFTGTPAAPTAAPGTNTTQIASTGFVKAAIDVILGGVSSAFDTLSEIATELALKATIASPTFTGVPAAPTAAVGTSTTQLATTAFAMTNEAWIAPSLLNSWANLAGYTPAKYRKERGRVYIRGVVNGGTNTSGTTIFNLPAGYRPTANEIFRVDGPGGVGIVVGANGNVVVDTPGSSNSYLSLCGMSFAID